jgi:LEA14-like dessication related protein
MYFMMKTKSPAVLSILVIVLGLIISCQTPEVVTEPIPEVIVEAPPSEIIPAPQDPMLYDVISALKFEKIEADTPETLYLTYNLDLHNAASFDAELLLQNPILTINEMPADASMFSLEIPAQETLTQQEERSIPLRLTFHASEYEKTIQHDFDEYKIELSIPLQYHFPDQTMIELFADAEAVFPRVRKPDFNITMIRILQAELINTRLRVSLQIDNPNHFPEELTSFNYELYGDGRFWAEGVEEDILQIPAKDSAKIDLFLTMNCTNMRRNVLDQVIKMTSVRYRFTGNAQVETGVEYLPRFIMDFKLEGLSDVVR